MGGDSSVTAANPAPSKNSSEPPSGGCDTSPSAGPGCGGFANGNGRWGRGEDIDCRRSDISRPTFSVAVLRLNNQESDAVDCKD